MVGYEGFGDSRLSLDGLVKFGAQRPTQGMTTA